MDNIKNGILGNEASAIMGISKEESCYSIYLKKKRSFSKEKSEGTYFRNKISDLIANEFTTRTGLVTRKENRNLVHKDYPFIIRKVNRRVIGENSILKCIIKNIYNGLEESDIISCLHDLSMSKADKCYLAILVNYKKLIITEIIRDEEKINEIINSEVNFWVNYVEKSIAPVDKNNSIYYFPDEYKEILTNYINIKEKMQEYEEVLGKIEKEITLKMGEANKGLVADYIVDFKSLINYKINGNVLKENYPDTFNKVCRKVVMKKLQVKNNKIM
ncbi:MAG: hypothetical protein GX275_14330 [Clostridiales bacterium]|nr:hypothetical protein [Clostridiales bacterium]